MNKRGKKECVLIEGSIISLKMKDRVALLIWLVLLLGLGVSRELERGLSSLPSDNNDVL